MLNDDAADMPTRAMSVAGFVILMKSSDLHLAHSTVCFLAGIDSACVLKLGWSRTAGFSSFPPSCPGQRSPTRGPLRCRNSLQLSSASTPEDSLRMKVTITLMRSDALLCAIR